MLILRSSFNIFTLWSYFTPIKPSARQVSRFYFPVFVFRNLIFRQKVVHYPEIIIHLWLKMSFRSSHLAAFLPPLAAVFPFLSNSSAVAVKNTSPLLLSAVSTESWTTPIKRVCQGILTHSHFRSPEGKAIKLPCS